MFDEVIGEKTLAEALNRYECGDFSGALKLAWDALEDLRGQNRARAVLIISRSHYAMAILGDPAQKEYNLREAVRALRHAQMHRCDGKTRKDLRYLCKQLNRTEGVEKITCR